MRKIQFLALGAVVALVGSLVPMSAASAAALRCGDTVTTNVVLTRNLTCGGSGLYVAAEGVTVNLNGFAVTGAGVGTGIDAVNGSPGGPGVTVTNGTVRGFATGMHGGLRLSKVKVVANATGMYGGGEVADSTFRGNGTAIKVNMPVSVSRSTFDANDLAIWGVYQVSVSGSTFRNNQTAIGCWNEYLEVTTSRFVGNSSSLDTWLCDAVLHDNTFIGGDVAARLDRVQEFRLDVRRNTFSDAGIGMKLTGYLADNRDGKPKWIVDNVFKDNGASGLLIDVTDIALDGTTDLVISGNRIKGNGFRPGSYVDSSGNPLTSGVWADLGAFTANRAVANAGHGIEAYNVSDGGGNTASGNGVEPQCIGVVCTP